MLQLGVTGTSKGMTEAQKVSVTFMLTKMLEMRFYKGVMNNGDCVGADATFFLIWNDIVINCKVNDIEYDMTTVGHIPLRSNARAYLPFTILRKPKPYLERNQAIVDCSSVLIATPYEADEILRSGTWSTIRRARKKGIKIAIVRPDGTVKYEVQ